MRQPVRTGALAVPESFAPRRLPTLEEIHRRARAEGCLTVGEYIDVLRVRIAHREGRDDG